MEIRGVEFVSNKNAAILRMLENAGKDPLSYDEWISNWKMLYEELENSSDSPSGFSQIEHAALGSLTNIKVTDNHEHLNSVVHQMLDKFKHPALLVTSTGKIAACNAKLKSSFNIKSGENVADLPLEPSQGGSLLSLIRHVLRSGIYTEQALFRKAHSTFSSHEYTLAITKSTSVENSVALVFIISAEINQNVCDLVKNQYDLTKAECQILVTFVKGNSLKEIANDRCRSHATIRTQFNSLMTKMGANCQASLLRTTFALGDFTNEIDKFSEVLKHPYRRQVHIMRPGGRIVEVCFSGNSSGTPVLHIPHAATHRYNAEIEEKLHEASIYLISVCPPGYGNSEVPLNDQSRDAAWVDDIQSVLETLKIGQCPVLATSAGTYRAFQLAQSLPDRISQVILLAACPPAEYWLKHGTSAPWVDAVLRISFRYPTLRKVILTAGLKAWTAVGSDQFHRLQLANQKKDAAALTKPANCCELEYALESAIKHGFKYLLEDVTPLFDNYLPIIRSSKCAISIIHGSNDTCLTYKGMIDFKNEFPDRIELVTIENSGFSIIYTDTELVIKHLCTALKKDLQKTHLIDAEQTTHHAIPKPISVA